jgi:hypothetical protein
MSRTITNFLATETLCAGLTSAGAPHPLRLLEPMASSRAAAGILDGKWPAGRIDHAEAWTALRSTSSSPAARPSRPRLRPPSQRFPDANSFLIGDSGEDDPEIHAQALRRHPSQIARPYIRNITGAKRDDARFGKVFVDVDAPRWGLFDDPVEIKVL